MLTRGADGVLLIGGVPATALAEEFGTPLYVLVEEEIRRRLRAYRTAFADHYPHGQAIYAGKAFLSVAMAEMVAEEGLGLDVTSGGELLTASRAGFPMSEVYFHGNMKTADEISLALHLGIGRFMVDNFEEMRTLRRLAAGGPPVRILLRLTPGIEAHTHEYIRTGQADSKFGFPLSAADAAVAEALGSPELLLTGIHAHIGSQILDLRPFQEEVAVLFEVLATLRDRHGFVAQELDVGGGLGIRYETGDDPPEIADLIQTLSVAVRREASRLSYPEPRLLVEPGRSVVGEAGVTLYHVGAVKEIPGVRTYAAVDGGMGDNPRPALYGARHAVRLAGRAEEGEISPVTIAGRYCESGDILAWDAPLPPLRAGDLLAVEATGAYNYAMAMTYNRVGRPAVVLVRPDGPQVIVARESYEDLLRLDRPLERAVLKDARVGPG